MVPVSPLLLTLLSPIMGVVGVESANIHVDVGIGERASTAAVEDSITCGTHAVTFAKSRLVMAIEDGCAQVGSQVVALHNQTGAAVGGLKNGEKRGYMVLSFVNTNADRGWA